MKPFCSAANVLLTAMAAWSAATCVPVWAIPVALPANLSAWGCTGVCASSAADGDIGLSPTGNARYAYVATSGSGEMGVAPAALVAASKDSATNGSRIVSPTFSAGSGDLLSMYFNYVSTDGKGFGDYAWARLLTGTGSFVDWLFVAQSTSTGPGKIIPGEVGKNVNFDPLTTIEGFKDWTFQTKTTPDNPINWSPLGPEPFYNKSCWKDNADGCGYTGWLKSNYSFTGDGDFMVEIGVTNLVDGIYDSGLAFDFANLTDSGTLPATGAVSEPATLGLMAIGMALFGLTAFRRRRTPS